MDQQLRLFTDAVLKSQGETQRLVRQVSQNLEIATQQAQEDNDNLIDAIDDLKEQIGELTEVMAEANGIWR
jgi:prephenate dehydrogenase